jgi:hypothetical protein
LVRLIFVALVQRLVKDPSKEAVYCLDRKRAQSEGDEGAQRGVRDLTQASAPAVRSAAAVASLIRVSNPTNPAQRRRQLLT